MHRAAFQGGPPDSGTSGGVGNTLKLPLEETQRRRRRAPAPLSNAHGFKVLGKKPVVRETVFVLDATRCTKKKQSEKIFLDFFLFFG